MAVLSKLKPISQEDKIVILGSARKNGNTAKAVSQTLGSNWKVIDLLDFKINHYSYDHVEHGNDDFLPIVNKLAHCSEIAFATPVYWYAMSFDRLWVRRNFALRF